MRWLISSLLIATLAGSAYSGQGSRVIGGRTWDYYIWDSWTSNPYIEIQGVSPSDGDVVIPADIDGIPTTKIKSAAFKGCSEMTSVDLPSNVSNVGSSAFHGCSRLVSIKLPKALTTIEDFTFSGCAELESFMMPTNVTRIGEYAFSDCKKITSMSIPAGTIGNHAFYGCSGLECAEFGIGVTEIGDSAFYNCRTLSKIIVPDGLMKIGSSAFYSNFYYGSPIGSPVSCVYYHTTIPDCVKAYFGDTVTYLQVGAPISYVFTYVANADGITVTGISPSLGSVSIPEVIDGQIVTKIGSILPN